MPDAPDITLPENHALLAAIVDSSEDAIISKNLNSIITSWNRAAEKLFQFTAAEMIGRSILTIIPKERLHEEDMILNAVRSGVKVDHFETQRLRKDGSLIPLSITVSPVKNAAGEIIGASKIARDISDKIVLEEKQALLASIVNSSDDAIITKTLDGFITSWNTTAETIFGYKEPEVIGKHISLIIPPGRMNEETEIITKIRAGEKVEHYETIRMRKDGSPVNLSLTVSPLKDKNDKVIGASKIARDITERFVFDKQLKAYAEELELLNKQKDDFIGIASHELKTPLTSIKLYGQLIEREAPEAVKPFLEKQQAAIGRLGRLISDLLDVSKISAGHLKYEKENFDLSQIIDNSIEAECMEHADYNILRLDHNKNIQLHGDKVRLEQVFANLISNAVKYSPNNKRVEVSAIVEQGMIAVSIKDFGIGMNETDKEKIFDRFFRIQSHGEQFGGLGLGLVYRI
jgi:PAS domain S-box-containing protein